MTTGRVMIARVIAPARMLTPRCMKMTNAPNPNKPYTTEGMPARLMMAMRIARVQRLSCGVFCQVDRCSDPQRHCQEGRDEGEQDGSKDGGIDPAAFQSIRWEIR